MPIALPAKATDREEDRAPNQNPEMEVKKKKKNPKMDFGEVWILANICWRFSWALVCYDMDYSTCIADRRC